MLGRILCWLVQNDLGLKVSLLEGGSLPHQDYDFHDSTKIMQIDVDKAQLNII